MRSVIDSRSGELPYSEAVAAGDLVVVSGQLGVTSSDGDAMNGSAEKQARSAFEGVAATLERASATWADVVDVHAYLRDIRDAQTVFGVAREFLKGDDFPAWTLMQTNGLQHPAAALQIQVVAHVGDGEREGFTPDSVRWMREYPMSGACRKGDFVFVSGQLPLDPDGNVIDAGDNHSQARLVFARVQEMIEAAGGKFDEDLLDLFGFAVDPRSMAAICIDVMVDEVLPNPPEHAPSVTVLCTTALLKPGATYTMRAICELGNGRPIAYAPESLPWRTLPISGATRKENGHLVTFSGLVPMKSTNDPATPFIHQSEPVFVGDPIAQARFIFDRLKDIATEAGISMDDVIDVTCLHKDARYIEPIMELSREYFTQPGPAWTAFAQAAGWQEAHLHEIMMRAWAPS